MAAMQNWGVNLERKKIRPKENGSVAMTSPSSMPSRRMCLWFPLEALPLDLDFLMKEWSAVGLVQLESWGEGGEKRKML